MYLIKTVTKELLPNNENEYWQIAVNHFEKIMNIKFF